MLDSNPTRPAEGTLGPWEDGGRAVVLSELLRSKLDEEGVRALDELTSIFDEETEGLQRRIWSLETGAATAMIALQANRCPA